MSVNLIAFEISMQQFSILAVLLLAMQTVLSSGTSMHVPEGPIVSLAPASEPVVHSKISHAGGSLGRLVEYELDKYGVLIKVSVAMSLVILIIGAMVAVSFALSSCTEGVRRRKRIEEWEASNKGISSPRKYTQSLGAEYLDLDDVETVASSLPPYMQI